MKEKRNGKCQLHYNLREELTNLVQTCMDEYPRKRSTAVNYRSTLTSFCHFLDQNDEPCQLSRRLIVRYEYWLRSRGLLRNSTSFYMRNLRSMCHMLKEKGIQCDIGIFSDVYTGVDKTRKRAMAEQTIRIIKSADLSSEPTLAYWRDLFLFSFYCRGMSFVDVAYLRENNVRNGYIRYQRRKTGRIIEIRIEQCMQEIISRYPGKQGYIFPIITSVNLDRAYYQYRSGICTFNKMLKILADRLGIPPFSSYMSRHTWATIARDKQIPISIISESMGHSSEKVTQIYLASFNQQTLDDANKFVIDI